MPETDEKLTPAELILTYSGLVLIFISVITFLYLILPVFSSPGKITALGDKVSGFSGLNFNAPTVYIIVILTIFFAIFSIYSLFYRNENLSMGFSKEKNRKFYGYLMIYILVQLVLSELITYFVPSYTNEFPFNESAPIQNFIFSYQTLLEAALYELFPITIAAVIISKMHGTPLSEGIKFYRMSNTERHIVSIVISLAASFLVSGTVLTFITAFFSLLVLNEIFLNLGFLKAYLTNFAVAMTNVTAFLISGNATLSVILPLFLFFLGFLGVYSLVQLGIKVPNETPEVSTPSAIGEVVERVVERKVISEIEPFVKSRCPECGQATYHIQLPNLSLKCTKCGHELDRDAVGEKNIVIDARNPSKF